MFIKYVNFHCTECGKQCKVKFHLDEHKRSVHDGIGLLCCLCEYKANSKTALNYHIESKHEKKKYYCPFYSKKFSLTSHLKNHEI